MSRTEEIRAILGISRAEFSRRYHIPIRTLENWDSGKQSPPIYVIELLERAVREDMRKEEVHTLARHTPMIEGQKAIIEVDGIKYERVVKWNKADGLYVVINNRKYFEYEIDKK